MESREGGGPVWLPMEAVSFADGGSSSTHDETGLLRRGSYRGRPVFVQALLRTTSPSGGGDDSSWAHLQAVSHANKNMASIVGFTKREQDQDRVYVVMDASEPLVVLRDLLLDKDSDVSWKERAQFAEDITSSLLLLTTPDLQDQQAARLRPVVDANHVLVHKQERRAQLAGLRCSGEAGKEDANEVSAALGLLLVELITRQPPTRARGRDSLVAFPSSSLTSTSSGIRLSVPTTGHQRSRSIGNANSLRSSSSGVHLSSSPSGSSSLASSTSSSGGSGVQHLSPRGSSSSGLDLSSSGSYARRGGLFSSDELKERRKDASMKESNWELVQVKAFTAWLNGYLARRGLKIANLQTDLQDGTLLNHFLEIVTSAKMRRWTAKPNSKITKLENLSIGLAYIQKDMAIKLVGIGAEDIYNGYLKLILGLVWSLFRGLQMRRLAAGGGGSMEEGLMKWVREQTQSTMDMPPSDFKYGFRDGQVFAALISRFDSSLVDLGAIKDKSPEEVLPLVFEIAEKHVGVPRLLEVTDLLSDDPDERAIQLYVSLFFDAFSLRKETAEFDSIVEITPPPGDDEPNSAGQATSDPIAIPADCPTALVELAKECCRTRADERPTLTEVNQRLHALVAEITQREEVAQKKEADEAERRDEVGRLKRLLNEKEVEIEALKGQLESNNHKKSESGSGEEEIAVREEEEESEAGAAKRKSEEAEASRREKEESEEAFEAKEEEVRNLKEVLHDAMEKIKEERREKEQLAERLSERERITAKSEEERRSLMSERDRLAERLEKQERAESEVREEMMREKEAYKLREEELEGRVKEAEERIRSQREELLERLRKEEAKTKSESEASEESHRREKETILAHIKERELDVEEAVRRKHEEDEVVSEKERQLEGEVRRMREEMGETLEKAKAELRKEMEEEMEKARTVERQRWETEQRETLKASEEEEVAEVRRLREQLSEALVERDEQVKEMEQLGSMLKERERQLNAVREEEALDRKRNQQTIEATQPITAKRELEEENQRLREALVQMQNDADEVRVERESEAEEVSRLREQLVQLRATKLVEDYHLLEQRRPDVKANEQVNRLKRILRELQNEADDSDDDAVDSEPPEEALVSPQQLKHDLLIDAKEKRPPHQPELNDSDSIGELEPNVRGDKVGLFLVGVPPTIGDGHDDVGSLLAGSTAAAMCLTLASPIQRVKLLLQTQAELVAAGRLIQPYEGVRDCFRRVVADEGFLSLWRGNVAHLLRIVSANALGFVLKDRFKNLLHFNKEQDGYWKWMAANVASGSAAGLATVLLTFSLDYVRTRLASDVLRVAQPGVAGGERQFSGLMDVYSQVQRREGTTGLYRGFTSSCIGVILYRGLYFGLYDSLKPMILRGRLEDSVVASFVLGWGVTLGAGLAAYPFDTVCRRMMTAASEHRGGLVHTLREIVAREGLAALWKGATANVAYALIGAGLLVAYDRAIEHASRKREESKREKLM